MKVLLDTHVWLWWITEPEKLADGAAAAMEEGRNEILFSVASSWTMNGVTCSACSRLNSGKRGASDIARDSENGYSSDPGPGVANP